MAVRPIFNRSFDKGTKGKFATGKYSVGICHRSGFKVPYRRLKFEPGTNYLVDASENDEGNSLVSHPQNYLPEKKVERIALRWSFPDDPMPLGTVVSADHLYLPVNALSVDGQYIIFGSLGTSVGTATSAGPAMVFTSAGNSMYYIVLFPGI